MPFAALMVLLGMSLPLAVLTTVGAHERGYALPLAMLAGLAFPVTWTVWYLRDERPYHRPHHDVV